MGVGVDNQRYAGLLQPPPMAGMGEESSSMVGICLGVDFHRQRPAGIGGIAGYDFINQVFNKLLISIFILYSGLEI